LLGNLSKQLLQFLSLVLHMWVWGFELLTQFVHHEGINTCAFIQVFNLHILILAIIISSLYLPIVVKKKKVENEIKNYKNAHQDQDDHIYPHHKRQKLPFNSQYSPQSTILHGSKGFKQTWTPYLGLIVRTTTGAWR